MNQQQLAARNTMSLITDKQVAQFHEQGYFLTDPMWDARMLGEVSREFDRLHHAEIRRAEGANDPRAVEYTRLRPFIGQAHTKSDLLKQFIASPIYLEAC